MTDDAGSGSDPREPASSPRDGAAPEAPAPRGRRRLLVAGLLVLALVVAGVALDVPRRGAELLGLTCTETAEMVDLSGEPGLLQPWDDLDFRALAPDPGDPEDLAEMDALREGLVALGDELGYTPVSGHLVSDVLAHPPVPVRDLGGRLVLATGRGLAGATDGAELEVRELPGGEPVWGLRTRGRSGGGVAVGEAYVTGAVTGEGEPQLLAVDAATGEKLSCTRLEGPERSERSLDLVTVDEEVIAVHEAPEAGEGDGSPGLRLVRLSPGGEVRWEADAPGPTHVTRADVAGQAVVVTTFPYLQFPDADVARALAFHAGGPTIRAYSTADGAELWTYPAEAEAADQVAGAYAAISEEQIPGGGVLVMRAAPGEPGEDGEEQPARQWVELLGADGEIRWSRPTAPSDADILRHPYLWDDKVVVHGPEPGDGLHAYDVATGELAWEFEAGAPDGLDHPVWHGERGRAVAGQWHIPGSHGGQRVDTETGEAHWGPMGGWQVHTVMEVGEYLVVEHPSGLVVYEPS